MLWPPFGFFGAPGFNWAFYFITANRSAIGQMVRVVLALAVAVLTSMFGLPLQGAVANAQRPDVLDIQCILHLGEAVQ